ncbi:MAG: large conductance mechanosensitive channel [Verrucomicrobiales bacterium]|jgi:large conductance mechanosensitive channel
MKSLIKEFREFILKGNVIDMAIGIIIGAAFSTVVKSFVNNVIMPPIGYLLGGIDFSQKKLVMKSEKTVDGVLEPEVAIRYGTFINDTISLLIVGFCVFLLVRSYNRAKAKFEEPETPKEEAAPEPSDEVKLLTEIRDVLNK